MGSLHNSGADRNSSNRPRTHFLQLFVPAVKKNGEAGADQVILITIINEKGSVICI